MKVNFLEYIAIPYNLSCRSCRYAYMQSWHVFTLMSLTNYCNKPSALGTTLANAATVQV